jgi:hypothetical protein
MLYRRQNPFSYEIMRCGLNGGKQQLGVCELNSPADGLTIGRLAGDGKPTVLSVRKIIFFSKWLDLP